MSPLKIIVVGGVAAGATAAAKARRVNEHADILLFERGPFVSFANCGLPYYVGGEIQDRQDLLLQTPEGFWKRYRIRVEVRHEVTSIDRARKIVHVVNRESGQESQHVYDKLILCPGAGAIVPPLHGIDASNIFSMKTVPDSDAVKSFIQKNKPRNVVVIGGGFIGLESAEVFHRMGCKVTIVEMLKQILPPFDADTALFVQRHLESQGVAIVLSDGVKAFHGKPLAREVELASGRRLPLDLAILSIGVRPELRLALQCGLEIGKMGGIVVNEKQQTSDPDIYAAGDAVETTHLVTGKKTRIPLAGPANKQGRVAGANAAGESLTFPGAVGTAIVECLDITAAKTGLSEKEAREAGYQTKISITHPLDHAGYYPGAEMMHMKIISEQESGRLLGAQLAGEKGVDKRIDVLATAILARFKVTDLENLDLAYAPQFSSAKDPVVMAGFVASNVWRGDVHSITCNELEQRLKNGNGLQIVDVRTTPEYQSGHLEKSRLIPIDELRDRLGELDPSKETIVYCRVGMRGYLAAEILQQNGFRSVKNLTGGILTCGQASSNGKSSSKAESTTVHDLFNLLNSGTAQLIDVRERDEFVFEHIENSLNFPLSELQKNPPSIISGKELCVICQSGVRSQEAVEILKRAGISGGHSVAGGLQAWKTAGYSTKKSKGPIPIMRQVQIVAGALAFTGGVFPQLRWVAAIVGAGLMFAGFSGFCGMAIVLSKMPWNRKRLASAGESNSCGR